MTYPVSRNELELRCARRACHALLMIFLRVLPMRQRRAALYLIVHRRRANLAQPEYFTEKVNWRILHDRRPLLAETCDKLMMKQLARGASIEGLRIPRTLWRGRSINGLAGVDLPERWVLKPTHRSGLVYFGTGAPDLDEIRSITRGWLDPLNAEFLGEWAYRFARPQFMVEERIGDSDHPPVDYKFFVFEGRARLIQVDTKRFHPSHGRRLYRPDWSPIDVAYGIGLADPLPAPALLESMISIAERAAAPFDFMRIDLYATGTSVWFGEFTPYPCGGLTRFSDPSLDRAMGSWWTLPRSTSATKDFRSKL